MSEMIDRIASVIAMSGAGCVSAATAGSIDACPYKVCRCRKAASAVIAAMRDPTEAMADAGDDSGLWGPGVAIGDGEEDASPKLCWRSMIDAALRD